MALLKPVEGQAPFNELFRADGRCADVILPVGFAPFYNKMSPDELRDFIRVVAGTKTFADSKVARHLKGPLLNEFNNPALNAPFDPSAFAQLIVASGKKAIWISTSPDAGCNGFANRGTLYRIDAQRMKTRSWSTAVPGSRVRQTAFTPYLLMDEPTVDEANHFALYIRRHSLVEVTFIGPIPRSWVSVARG